MKDTTRHDYALIVRAAPLDIQRPIQLAREMPTPRASLSRMARVLIVGALGMLLYVAGYGLVGLCLMGFWGIIGAATRQREDTSERVYTAQRGAFIIRVRGDAETDTWYDKRA